MLSHVPSTYTPALAGAGSASLEASPIFQSPGSGGIYRVTFQPAAAPRRAGARPADPTFISLCPDCGATLQRAEGCWLCRSCGYSPCS